MNLDKVAIRNFKNFLFDCDGVIWKQNNLLPGAQDLLLKLKELNKRVFLVSNNSTLSLEQYEDKCKLLQLTVDTSHIVSASNIFANYLKSNNFKGKVYVVGEAGISTELDRVGIPNLGVGEDNRYFRDLVSDPQNFDDEVKAVVVGFDTKFNMTKMTMAASYISCRNCKFYATNADAQFPSQQFLIPGTGCMVKAIETATNQEATITGKPFPFMFDVMKSKYGLEIDDTIMVGDNLYTDIAFGNRNKLVTLLVFTGVTTPDLLNSIDHSSENWPRYCCESLQDLFNCLV